MTFTMLASRADNGGRITDWRALTLIEPHRRDAACLNAAARAGGRPLSPFFRRGLELGGKTPARVERAMAARAVAEGVPVLLWIDAKQSSYGLITQSHRASRTTGPRGFAVDSTLTIEAFAPDPLLASEDNDERTGGAGRPAGHPLHARRFFDEASIGKIVIPPGCRGGARTCADGQPAWI